MEWILLTLNTSWLGILTGPRGPGYRDGMNGCNQTNYTNYNWLLQITNRYID